MNCVSHPRLILIGLLVLCGLAATPRASLASPQAQMGPAPCYVRLKNATWSRPTNVTLQQCIDNVGLRGARDASGSAIGFWDRVWLKIEHDGTIYLAANAKQLVWKRSGLWRQPQPAGAPGLTGKVMYMEWKDNRPYYTTYYRQWISLCDAATYYLVGQSQRRTVMDNIQPGNWQDTGRWSVERAQQGSSLRLQSNSGETAVFELHRAADGSTIITSGGVRGTLLDGAACP